MIEHQTTYIFSLCLWFSRIASVGIVDTLERVFLRSKTSICEFSFNLMEHYTAYLDEKL